MSLKRADVLRLLDTPPQQRGALFLDYMLADVDGAAARQLWTAEQRDLQHQLLELKTRVRELAVVLATHVGRDEAPREYPEIEAMIRNDVYYGIGRKKWKQVTLPRSVQDAVDEIELLRRKQKRLRQRLKAVATGVGAPEQVERLRIILGNVSDWMTNRFVSITNASYVSRINVTFGRVSAIAIEIEVELEGGARGTPQQFFSEGYQDLVALLYFVAVARAAAGLGQARVLILDDVVQSVDAGIRLSLMDSLVREFHDWQLLITAHDRLWRTQLLDIFRRAGHPVSEIELRSWRFESGPTVASSLEEPDAELLAAMDSGRAAAMAASSGRVLERVSDQLSWRIPISIQRRRGDSYSLGDLWPGTMKALRPSTIGELAQEVDKWVHLRNLLGAHYNEWAEGVALSEAEAFARAVLALLGSVRCGECGTWVERSGRGRLSCRCGCVEVAGIRAK